MLRPWKIPASLRNAHQEIPKDNFWTTMIPSKVNRKIFKPNALRWEQIQMKRKSELTPVPRPQKQQKPRYNDVNIQMLPKNLHEQVFKNYKQKPVQHSVVEACNRTLAKHGMVHKEASSTPDVDIKLPPLKGNNLEEHFWKIGEQQSEPYLQLVDRIIENIPDPPKKWLFRHGWTRYEPGKPSCFVDYPLEDDLIFDVEVCMLEGKAPTLATAVSSEAWYGWVSQSLIDGSSKPVTDHNYHEDVLIPLESKPGEKELEHSRPKIIIGHNVSYDRSKIKEQYWLNRTGTRFIDTMSLHVCVGGLTSYQRAMLKSKKADPNDETWKELSSLNGLSDVHKLYCGFEIEKTARNLFVDGSLAEIREEFQKVMSYCSEDVKATHRIFQKLFPMYRERFPHPVTFAGMLELGTAYLPVNGNWRKYIENSERTYEELDVEAKVFLAKRADYSCQLLHNDEYKKDMWMWDQDWKTGDLSLKKSQKKVETARECGSVMKEDEEELDPLDVKFEHLLQLQVKSSFLPGYPGWYKKLCVTPSKIPLWTPGPHLIGTGMQITPKLLNLTWEGFPLHYIRGLGWGLLVPFNPDCVDKQLPLEQLLKKCPLPIVKNQVKGSYMLNIDKEVCDHLARKEYYSRVKKDKSGGVYKGSGIWCNTILEDCVFFFKLPHKDGASHRVGNPLAKDFLNKFSENVLAGDSESAEQILSIARKLSYWRNNRNRIMEQMVVLSKKENESDGSVVGAILPLVVVCGTLTRRAVEPTWMTASNAHKERIGSELRAMIQAPPGYKIVGADVDAQELWIASVIGDASFARMHGATPLGWMTLNGNKTDGTDMHSVTAKAVGITRDHAKVINYARIYGAGQKFAETLLKQFNPTMPESEARSKAQKMFTLTKGKRLFQLQSQHCNDLADVPYSKWHAFETSKLHGKKLEEMFNNAKWVDGTESAMFNRLEEIAGLSNPRTPFLDCRLSRALEPENLPDDRFLPTRVNWVVQSGAVDFLHLMLVCMRWLMADSARFCLSFHDEVRYLVKEDHKYRAALAMHVTNLLTRAFCSVKLGINDLPNSVAFFTSVEIDDVLRKESKQDCKTPSNPHGLLKGFGIPNGESLNIYDAALKAKGSQPDWCFKDKSQ